MKRYKEQQTLIHNLAAIMLLNLFSSQSVVADITSTGVNTPTIPNTTGDYTTPSTSKAIIGDGANGSVTVDGGSTLNNTNAFVTQLSSSSATVGTLVVTGQNTLFQADILNIGAEGTGQLEITQAGQADVSSSVQIISSGSNTSTILLDGASTNLDIGGVVHLGGLSGGGAGDITIRNGAQLSHNAGNNAIHVGSTPGGYGSITIKDSGSQLNTSARLIIGSLNGAGGLVSITNGGQLIASGSGSVIGSGGTGEAIISGQDSLWESQNHRMVIGSGGASGTITIEDNGQLTVPVIDIGSGTSSGTLDITNSGTATCNIDAMQFPHSYNQGATGTINVNDSGILDCEVNMYVGGTLSGDGTVNKNLTAHSGLITPGNPVGSLSINDSFTSHNGANINIEVGGTTAGTFDLIAITNSATFTGGTVAFSLANSFLPTASFSVTFLTASSTSGSTALTYDFSQLESALGSEWSFQVVDNGTSLRLEGAYQPPGC